MEGTDLNWRKSSYSGNGGGECVEVSKDGRVFVRDTQDRTGPVLAFSMAAWKRFADQVKRSLATDSSRHSQGILVSDDRGCPFVVLSGREIGRASAGCGVFPRSAGAGAVPSASRAAHLHRISLRDAG
jgi:hypothetical protein